MVFRKATEKDNLKKIAELLYYTDPYIYPYWFENLDKCRIELPPLLIQEKFFFNVNNLYIALQFLRSHYKHTLPIRSSSKPLHISPSELSQI